MGHKQILFALQVMMDKLEDIEKKLEDIEKKLDRADTMDEASRKMQEGMANIMAFGLKRGDD